MSEKSTVTSGWDQVTKNVGGGGGTFLKIETDTKIRIRVLGNPRIFHVHNVRQEIDGKEVFRQIPATDLVSDDWLGEISDLWPREKRYALHVVVIEDDEAGEICVLESGPQIFMQLKELYNNDCEENDGEGDLTSFDILIKREGSGQQTKYSLASSRKSAKIDVEGLKQQIESDSKLSFESIYPSVDGDAQKRMFESAKFSTDYDPIGEAMEDMTLKQAKNTRMPFGAKYGPSSYPPNGMKLGDIMKTESGYVGWVADNVTSNFEVAAAARVLIQGADHIEKGGLEDPKPTKRLAEPKAKKKAKIEIVRDEEDDDDEELERSTTELEDLMEKWPIAMEPQKYLNRWKEQGGKHTALAQEIVDLQNVEAGITDDEDEDIEDDELDSDASEEETEAEDIEEDDDDDDEEDREDLLEIAVDLIDEHVEEPSVIVKLIKKASGKRTSKVKDLTSKELNSLIKDVKANHR